MWGLANHKVSPAGCKSRRGPSEWLNGHMLREAHCVASSWADAALRAVQWASMRGVPFSTHTIVEG